MRVIAGNAKGRRLKVPKGLKTRPTGDRVKEAIFNIIAPDVAGSRFLDLFAGSGAMGIEALSRGAVEAVFVENDRAAVNSIKANLAVTGFVDHANIITADVFPALTGLCSVFDLVYIDPPYAKQWGKKTIEVLIANQLAAPTTTIMLEIRSGDVIPDKCGNFNLLSLRKYGDTSVGFYRNS